jgi:hypothetical protein
VTRQKMPQGRDAGVALNGATVVQRRPGIVYREIQGEAVLLELASGRYFAVNKVGTTVWEALGEGITVAELEARIVEEFDVDDVTAWRDLEDFLKDLHKHGLVETTAP